MVIDNGTIIHASSKMTEGAISKRVIERFMGFSLVISF